MEPVTAGWMVASATIKAYGSSYFGEDNVAIVASSNIIDAQISDQNDLEILQRISEIEEGLESLQGSINAIRGGPYESGLLDLISAFHTESSEREESIRFARQSFMAAAGQETPVRAVDSLALVAICDLLLGRNRRALHFFDRAYELGYNQAREQHKQWNELVEKKWNINTRDTLIQVLFDRPNPRFEEALKLAAKIEELGEDVEAMYFRIKELDEILEIAESPYREQYDITELEKSWDLYWQFIPDEVLIERGWKSPPIDAEASRDYNFNSSLHGGSSPAEKTPEEKIRDNLIL